MQNTLPNSEATLENCDTIIVGLGARRFVIVHHDETNRLQPLDRSGIRDLQPGDAVIYDGNDEVVHAIDVYQ